MGRKRKSSFGGTRFLLRFAGIAVVLYCLGFLAFLYALPAPNSVAAETLSADGIVALTGQDRRLSAAVDLLKRGVGQRLLISGVNPSTTREELRELLNGEVAFDCCLDLGFEARNTRGNAVETAEWARENGYDSIIVVTGYDHMPRSLLEFSAAMPDVMLIPYPVGRDGQNAINPDRLPRINGEYAKYLASWVRISLISQAAAS